MVKRRVTTETVSEEEPVVISSEVAPALEVQEEENPEFEKLLEAMEEIRKNRNVLGYILRNEEQAFVDLDEPTRIVEYALLTSQALDSSQTLASSFNLGEPQTVLMEGRLSKAVCINMSQSRLILFLEKEADYKAILEGLRLQQA